MSYFSSQYSSSPVLTMSPQHAHQSMGMANFGHHTPSRFAPMPNQFAVAQPARPAAAGRKRSRDEASENLEPDIKSLPVEEPEEEWIYGPGMTLIKKSTGYVMDASSQSGTWVEEPRRRGRGGWRGRGGRKGGPAAPKAEQVIDDGSIVEIVNDECVLPEDPEGETKVDKSGNLQGGRDYRCRTFTVSGRGDRLYMLSTEPARCVGFRDSYLFFTKHKKLYKIIVDDDEKRDMIERDIIPHSYKGGTELQGPIRGWGGVTCCCIT